MIDRVCISITSACQLNCLYCHFDKHICKKNIKTFSDKELETILLNLYDYAKQNQRMIKIGIVGSGEPLLCFGMIREMVEEIDIIDKENLLTFYTISNGVCFTKEMGNFFLKHHNRIKLCFSLDGYQEIHDMCRVKKNGEGSFVDVMHSIDMYKSIFGCAPAINATVHRQTLKNAKKVIDFFQQNFSEVTFSRLVDEVDPRFFITKEEFNDFLNFARESTLSMRQFGAKKYDCTMYGQLCGVGRTNVYLDNGKVYPCGRFVGSDKYVLGNATDSFKTIECYMNERISPCCEGMCYFDNILKG